MLFPNMKVDMSSMDLTWAVEERPSPLASASGRGHAGGAQLAGLDGQAPSIRLGDSVACLMRQQ